MTFDAVAFLQGLAAGALDLACERLPADRFAEPTPTQPTADSLTPADLPEPWRELYEERAAIREFDGGQAREHAEAEALRETVAAMRAAEREAATGPASGRGLFGDAGDSAAWARN